MAAVEICPFCKKPFKRLKSHLPHCKMAGDTDSKSVLSPINKVHDSVTPKFLNAEKKKGQIKSTEMASKKENKKSKFDLLVRNKAKTATSSLEAPETVESARSGSLPMGEDAQKQMKYATGKPHKVEGSKQSTSEDAQTQPAEKVFSETKLAKKSSMVQKSSSKATSDENELASSLALELPIQNGKSASESSVQIIKSSPKQRQKKEQNVSDWPDSFIDDLQPIPQRFFDTIELVIENHRVRVLRKRCESSVQNILLNKAIIGNQKIGRWLVKSSFGDAEIALADGQPIMTEPTDGKSSLGLDCAWNIWNGETEEVVTTVKAHTPDGHFVGSCRKVSSVPLQLATGIKSMINENPVCFKGEEYPQESQDYTSPKSTTYPSFAEALTERDDETSNYLTSLEKDTDLCSGTVVTIGGKNSGISLKRLSLPTLEMTAAHWCLPPDRGIQSSPLGLEWFPELYPNYRGLGLFSRRQPQWATRVPELQVFIPPYEGHQAWNGYNNRYINVKKGGMAGISILLLGYCVISCAWSYGHISKASSLLPLLFFSKKICL
ncbi:uncharacterized protein C17orf80 homolog isoform X2 [Rhineura floridana]|uniref:uncharacterized protein C17orf80 homolog isoform X2 n=1 Tax=Rhineura floridana TaxID=261503 RepID=UPI002AC80381|nr:uncharacterized protein C17orf80 homolog isoform X2 [Rhineura floridana]